MGHCNKNQSSESSIDPGISTWDVPPESALDFKIFQQMDEIAPSWDQISGNILMSSDYLAGLEAAPAKGMEFRYMLVYQGDELVAKLYFQIVHFNAARSLGNEVSPGDTQCSFFSRLVQSIKLSVARNIDFYTIVCGNLLLTGENGWEFAGTYDRDKREDIIEKAYTLLKEQLKNTYTKDEISVSLCKELYPESRLSTKFVQTGKWHEFLIQPNMLLNLDHDWYTFDDYLDAMQSKYRVRARRAEKKLGDISIEPLREADIQAHSKTLYNLYLETTGSAGFNMVNLGQSYFYEVKSRMKDKFHLKVFKKGNQIVGFFSYFIFDDKLVAHMVGFNSALNKTNQIYLNMLYQLVREGISQRLGRINLGRTAMEIKSSVGAVPVDMFCYIRHRNRLYNKITPNLIELLSPQEEWTQRHPFRMLNE